MCVYIFIYLNINVHTYIYTYMTSKNEKARHLVIHFLREAGIKTYINYKNDNGNKNLKITKMTIKKFIFSIPFFPNLYTLLILNVFKTVLFSSSLNIFILHLPFSSTEFLFKVLIFFINVFAKLFSNPQ